MQNSTVPWNCNLFKTVSDSNWRDGNWKRQCNSLLCFTIPLLFWKDFLQGMELPHDAVPASRSDDNRRATGAIVFFSIRNSLYANKFFWRLAARRRGTLESIGVCSWFHINHFGCGLGAPCIIIFQLAGERKKAGSVVCHLHFHPAYARFLALHHHCHNIHFK